MKNPKAQTPGIKAPLIRGLKTPKKSMFTPGQIKFLENNVSGKHFAEVVVLFNKHFKADFSNKQIKNFCMRKGIKNDLTGWSKRHCWSKEELSFLENLDGEKSTKELTVLLNSTFNLSLTRKQVRNACKKYRIKTRQIRCTDNSEVPLNTERIRRSWRYIFVKVAMAGPHEKRWQEKHRWIWEQANGKIPKGMLIIFLDNNPFNCTLKNLAIISRAENIMMSRFGLYTDNQEATLAGIAVVRHSLAIHRCLRKNISLEEYKRFIIRECRSRKKRSALT
jgi:hypothetical protein